MNKNSVTKPSFKSIQLFACDLYSADESSVKRNYTNPWMQWNAARR